MVMVWTAFAAPASAQAPGPLVSPEWLAVRLGDSTILILQIDANSDRYDTGHIPGAHFVPQDEIAVDPPGGPGYEIPALEDIRRTLQRVGVDGRRHIVVYSAGPSPLPATRLWLTLDYLGLGDRASVLDGMYQRWTAEGRPVTADVPRATASTFSPVPRSDVLVNAEWIHARLDEANVVLIDARPDDEYTGEDGGMGGMANPGHIPGASQLYYEDLIRDRQTDPSFLSIEALRARFASAGAGPDKQVVTYCMIGMRASLTYFVGRLLGYDMTFYDGSWHDWGTRDLPYVRGTNRR
jgi:thiosulfate/3-mercaptopyruvate sulfurtransferase